MLSIYFILEMDLYLIKVIRYLHIIYILFIYCTLTDCSIFCFNKLGYCCRKLMLCLSIDLGATEKPKIGPLFKPALERPCWCMYRPRSFCKGHDFWDLDKMNNK